MSKPMFISPEMIIPNHRHWSFIIISALNGTINRSTTHTSSGFSFSLVCPPPRPIFGVALDRRLRTPSSSTTRPAPLLDFCPRRRNSGTEKSNGRRSRTSCKRTDRVPLYRSRCPMSLRCRKKSLCLFRHRLTPVIEVYLSAKS